MNTKSFLFEALLCLSFVLITALFAQIEIPLPYVPISGQTLAVGLTATILGSRLGALTMILYVLGGALGAPFFTGLDAGMDVLTGPTGGYLLGFILAAFAIGRILEKYGFTVKKALIANIAGMVIILIAGMIGLKISANMQWIEALTSGVLPFLLTGVIKALLAGWLGIVIRRQLIKTGLIIPNV